MERVQRLFAEMLGLIYERELRIMREFDLSLLEYYTLQIVVLSPGASLKEVGQRLALPKSTVTFVADALERRALVERRRSQEDRRVWLLQLTEDGQALVKKVLARKSEFLLPVISGLSDPERQTLFGVMTDVARQLRGGHEHTAQGAEHD